MAHSFLRGVYTPLITPFRDGVIDYAAFASLVDWNINNGAHGVVVGGTSGEPAALSVTERENLLRVAISIARRRAHVIAATGAASFADTAQLTEHATQAGASAVLVVTPIYAKPSQTGMKAYYEEIARRTDRPLLVYQITSRTGVTLSLDSLVELAGRIPNLVGMKLSDNDRDYLKGASKQLGENFRIFSGLFDISWQRLDDGACGFIAALSNVIPGAVRDIYDAASTGKKGAAANGYERIANLIMTGALDVNPVPVKYMAWRMGLIPSPECRLPLVPMEERPVARIEKALVSAGLVSPS
ncbi:MAG: 4-hydroxy-tetrahydrodipicolinate synthase [Rhodobacteraceae bacterium]|nr:4-hydroxy-tetrahydrodipicolinate synthase [Paracoccaceae bacterium]